MKNICVLLHPGQSTIYQQFAKKHCLICVLSNSYRVKSASIHLQVKSLYYLFTNRKSERERDSGSSLYTIIIMSNVIRRILYIIITFPLSFITHPRQNKKKTESMHYIILNPTYLKKTHLNQNETEEGIIHLIQLQCSEAHEIISIIYAQAYYFFPSINIIISHMNE
jgi:hypothetical protein